MKISELYSEYFANWISDGSMISRDKISLLGIRPLFDRFLTNKCITRVWMVCAMPVHFDLNLSQLIRTEMYEAFPDVRTVVHMYNSPVDVKVNSDTYNRQMNSAANRYYQYREVFEQLTDVQKETGVIDRMPNGAKFSIDNRTLNKIKDAYDSYMYVHNAANHDKEFVNTHFFIQASCADKANMTKYDRELIKMLQGRGIVIKRVRGNVGQYLDNFCPASFMQSDVTKFPTILLSQENVAAMLPNKTKGLVGKRGFMIGEDKQTHLPFTLDLTGSDAAQVIMICGKSGCGKTFLGEEIAIQLTAFGIHCSVTDIKGGEWNKLLKYIDLLEIDMSGDSARFVNLMRLDDLGCTVYECVEAYDYAISNTVGIFEVATNLQENEGNPADLRSILSQAVEKVYTTNNILKNNPDTFVNTKNFKYEMVLDILSDLENSRSYTNDQKRLCKLIKSRCSPYFMSEGRYSAAFVNELTVADVLNVPMVIYNFNKNRGEDLDIIDNLRVFMARCMDSRKHFIRKRQGLHQAVFYEELQRCGSMSTFIRNISTDVTGSRSNNLTVFLLLNAVSTFDADNFAAIRSNITTKIVGKVEEEDINKLVTEYGCGKIQDYMNLIHENDDNRYDHCFAVYYDTGNDIDKLILHTIVPKEMQESLSTRDHYVIG